MNKLHSGWTYAKLGEVANYINGKAFRPSDWKQKGYPIIRIQNLNDPNAKFNYADSTHESKYIVNRGDLLVSWSASLGVYIWNYSTAWLNQHIFKVDFNEKIVTRDFLFYAIKQTIRDLHEKTHGTGMVHVTKNDFEKHEIPLPPLREQHRIAAKLEKLLTKVDQCRTRLEKIPGLLKQFRQKILTSAFAGELTKDYRETKTQDQTIESILDDLKKARLKNSATKNKKNLWKSSLPMMKREITRFSLNHGVLWL